MSIPFFIQFSFGNRLVTKVFNFSFFVQHSGLLAIFGHRKDILLLVKENESMRSCSLRRIYVPWSIRVKNPKYYKHLRDHPCKMMAFFRGEGSKFAKFAKFANEK